MRTATIDDDALVDALSGVFSRKGYDGASLACLAEATGLKRASLYHRFPGGKAEMLGAVFAKADERFRHVLAPAFGDAPPAVRAQTLATRLREYYQGGRQSCLIVALSVSTDEHREVAEQCLTAWVEAFAAISLDAGMDAETADLVAWEAVGCIEGALVIAATSGRTALFERVVSHLPSRLTHV